MDRYLLQWRGLLWILVMIALMLTFGALVNDFTPEPQAVQPENYSASSVRSGEYRLDPGSVPQLVIEGGVGDVTIRGERDSAVIGITYTKTAYSTSEEDAEQELDDVHIFAEDEGNWVKIDTVQESGGAQQRANRVDLAITVPVEIQLNVVTAMGDIQISNVNVQGDFTARAVLGNLMIENMVVRDGMTVQADAGSVTFAGTLGPAGTYTLTASVGSLVVRLPAETRAAITASTTLGTITVAGLDFADPEMNALGSGGSFSGRLGDGSAAVTITNQMGDIRIEAE
jgi:DUF4097 and DUF4098 domain-containing protein YvlB